MLGQDWRMNDMSEVITGAIDVMYICQYRRVNGKEKKHKWRREKTLWILSPLNNSAATKIATADRIQSIGASSSDVNINDDDNCP